MESLWRRQTKIPAPETSAAGSMSQGIYRDVIVVGAGMAGLLIAYYLKEQGKTVLVLEANEIASGQTERTTAKITSQHGVKYSKLIEKVGAEKARMYAQANEAAIREYDRLIQSQGIECQFERVPAYLYTGQNVTKTNGGVGEVTPEKEAKGRKLEQEKGIANLKREAEVAISLGIDAFFTAETELPFAVTGAVGFRNQAQFSPLEFVKYISAELEILEHTKVTAINGHRVMTKDAVMSAEKIVVATHYPLLNVPGFYFLRLHQERSYVLALSGCKKISGMYYGIDPGGLSFRQAGDILLLGGSAHRTGENKTGGAYDYLVQVAEKYFPNAKEETRWSAQDCMTHDKIPFIGKYSVFTPHLYVATGFGKWGMTSSMIAAMILRDELCGIENPYSRLFSPQRFNVRASFYNLMIDIGMSVKGLVKGVFLRPRCAHMGCALAWNPDEKSWDCPCHGSRFKGDGKLRDNPAKKDARVK